MDTTPYAQLGRFHHQRHLLIASCERLLAVLAALESRAMQGEVQQLLQNLYTDKLQVLVVGKRKRGKSTLINALLGQKVLPAYPVPTTALLSVVTWGEQPMATLYSHPSRNSVLKPPRAIPLTELERYLVINTGEQTPDEYERAELCCPLPLCSMGVELIDTPALDDDERYLEATMRRMLTVDAILFALACESPPGREESLEIEKIRRTSQQELFFLCNRFDLVEPSVREQVKRRWLTYLGQFTGSGEQSIFFTNAKGALTGRLMGSQEQVEHSNLLLVEEALYTFLAHRGGERLRRTAARLQAATRGMRSLGVAQQRLAGSLEDELSAIEQALHDARQADR
jgi:GTPase SAR1 family protein